MLSYRNDVHDLLSVESCSFIVETLGRWPMEGRQNGAAITGFSLQRK